MEPLSIIGSVVGILSVTAKLTAVCTSLAEKGKHVPDSMQSMVLELDGLRGCLGQLQPFLQGTEQAAITRSAMISMDQVVTINTSCVLTLSDLERMLDSYKLDGPLSRLDRLRWVRNESKFNQLLLRIRASRSSLNLILTILTCVSIEQARNAIGTLIPTVEGIRQSSEDVSRRLAALESALASTTPRANSIVENNGRLSSLRDSSILENGQFDQESPTPDTETLTIGACNQLKDGSLPVMDFTKEIKARNGTLHINKDLELLLEKSRPYSRLLPTKQKPSASSVSYFSGAVSYFSGLSLSDVSNLSVFSLPIFMHEIWNNYHYVMSLSAQRSDQNRETQLDTAEDRTDGRHEATNGIEQRPSQERVSQPTSLIDSYPYRTGDSIECFSIRKKKLPPVYPSNPRRTVMILILGASESGKIVMLNQMLTAMRNGAAMISHVDRGRHAKATDRKERKVWRQVLFINLLSAFNFTIDAVNEHGWQYQKAECLTYEKIIKDAVNSGMADDLDIFASDFYTQWAMEELWTDAVFQQMLKSGNAYAQYESVHYLFCHRFRLFSPTSEILNEDILHSSLKTAAITETLFMTEEINYHVFNAGGARHKRQDWVHAFQGVHHWYYVASLAEYDICLNEDKIANQMQKSLVHFETLLAHEWLTSSSIILFLTDVDIFERKIKRRAISDYWPDFEGPEGDYESAVDYFINKFAALQQPDDTREIRVCVTDTTDPGMIIETLREIEDRILIPASKKRETEKSD